MISHNLCIYVLCRVQYVYEAVLWPTERICIPYRWQHGAGIVWHFYYISITNGTILMMIHPGVKSYKLYGYYHSLSDYLIYFYLNYLKINIKMKSINDTIMLPWHILHSHVFRSPIQVHFSNSIVLILSCITESQFDLNHLYNSFYILSPFNHGIQTIGYIS